MSDLKKIDLEGVEEWREYEFDGRDKPYRIDNPKCVEFRPDSTTHRVTGSDGIVHCVPAPGQHGCVPMERRGCRVSKMTHVRIDLSEANAFVTEHHRHHKPVVGHLFSLGAVLGEKIVGVAIVGRPVARMRDDGETAEVTRLCTDGTKNACSFLYGAAARAAFALGFKKIGTYILASEPGTSLTATGWRPLGERGGGSWSKPSRSRVDKHPTQVKMLFEKTF